MFLDIISDLFNGLMNILWEIIKLTTWKYIMKQEIFHMGGIC